MAAVRFVQQRAGVTDWSSNAMRAVPGAEPERDLLRELHAVRRELEGAAVLQVRGLPCEQQREIVRRVLGVQPAKPEAPRPSLRRRCCHETVQ